MFAVNKRLAVSHHSPTSSLDGGSPRESRTRLPALKSARHRSRSKEKKEHFQNLVRGADTARDSLSTPRQDEHWLTLRDKVELKRRQRLWLQVLAMKTSMEEFSRRLKRAQAVNMQRHHLAREAVKVQRFFASVIATKRTMAGIRRLLSMERFVRNQAWRCRFLLRIVRKRIAARRCQTFFRYN